jgi:hypothetical protein
MSIHKLFISDFVFTTGVQKRCDSPTRTPKKKKNENKSMEDIAADVLIEFLAHGLMTYTEPQRHNMVIY